MSTTISPIRPDIAVPRGTAPSPAFTNGQRVKYVGIHGRADGPTGRVIRQYKSGVLVHWFDGSKYSVHPQDIAVVTK